MFDTENDSIHDTPKRSKGAILLAGTLALGLFGGIIYMVLDASDEKPSETIAETTTITPVETTEVAKEAVPAPNAERLFFAYDTAALSGEARADLLSWATYLQANPTVTVRLEGHCDDRGSRAYNQTLGLERAEATKEFLVENGISAARIQTTSFGEDQPLRQGSGEENWHQNRRVKIRTLDATLSQN